MRGRTAAGLLMAVMALVLAAPAAALAAIYQGHVKDVPTSGVSFEVKKLHGKRKVLDVHFFNIPDECDDGSGSVSGEITGNARIRDGSFDLRERESDERGRFAGRIAGGSAKGTIKETIDFGTFPPGVCEFDVRWVADKA